MHPRCVISDSPAGRTWVGPQVVLEVVEHNVSGTTTPEDQEVLREERAVLADPAEVAGGQAGHSISDEPLAPAGAVGARDRVEGVERGRLVVVRRRNDRAA